MLYLLALSITSVSSADDCKSCDPKKEVCCVDSFTNKTAKTTECDACAAMAIGCFDLFADGTCGDGSTTSTTTSTSTSTSTPPTTTEDTPPTTTTTTTTEDTPPTTTTTTTTEDTPPTTTTTTTTTKGEDTTPTTTTTTEEGPTTTVLGCDETKDGVRTDYCDLECTEEPYLAMVLEFNVCSVGGMGNSRNELFDIIQDCVGKTLDETVGVSVTGIHLTMNDFLFTMNDFLCGISEDEKGYTYRFGLSLCEFGCNDLFTLYEYVLGITETVALKDIGVCVWVATSYTLRDIDGSFTAAIIGYDCERVDTANSGSGIEMIYPSLMVFVLGLIAALSM